ncbi:sister chromatid cohesion protein PDS5 homolog B [Brienomyrus brachyistius]|uniref:sister chromatid cohesion protein PDS5 homolog B n=1 Tax=Brienomyrus brachyistius TaxID=42636 RepID=UPI0020B360D2|nr:sister chromatid cohesion protein PDS5 homolog B [Brienomyrus brachyistius]
MQMVVKIFTDMDQDSEEEKERYLHLALHLASDFLLKHPDKDVRLLVACGLADIFRIYRPDARHTSPEKLKDIFMFITQQLTGLEDTKSVQFNEYFYLLENIAWVKSYNICFELEDSNEIFTQLYKTLFQVINNSHEQKVQIHMVELMSSIICEGDTVSQELLDTVLVNLVPGHKNLHKQPYELAKALLKRTAQAIQPCITNFFTRVLMLGETSASLLSEHVLDLMLELYSIDSRLIFPVLPQLEFKLKSCDSDQRLQVVKLLTKMFGAKESELATQNKSLWQLFLGRFNDIHVPVRLECVKFASPCLINHPDLAKDLTDYLRGRSHDLEEAIRHNVIVSIVTAAKKDLALVNDHLLSFVRERTLDKKWRVRKQAMMGLAQIYRKYALQAEAGREAVKRISWIKNKLLHIYYQKSMEDRVLVEQIFAQYMVPHTLETTEKMKCLYYLYAALDVNAVKALNEMWKCQSVLRRHVKDLLDLLNKPKSETCSKAVFFKVSVIARNLPALGRAKDFVKKLAQLLEEDGKIRKQLEMVVSPCCARQQAEGCVRDITKALDHLGQHSSPFAEMVTSLLERIAPVHIDAESISALIKQMNRSIEGTANDDDEGVSTEQAVKGGLQLLKVLSFTHSMSFHSAETLESLLDCMKMDDEKVAEASLQIFRNTGGGIEESFPHLIQALLPLLQQKAKNGLPRQAKLAVHCIHTIFSNRDAQFAEIFQPLHQALDAGSPEKLITPLITLGHLAMLAPGQFSSSLKSLVANFVIKDLLMNDQIPGKKAAKLWAPHDELSPETLAKIQGIKLMVRWLLGMKNSQSEWANSIVKVLTAILKGGGDLTGGGRLRKVDMSRLRLAAGCAVLRLAQEPCYQESITQELYRLCALLINDECVQVRQAFTQKLHSALWRLRLPIQYMAIYALCTKDPMREHQAHARQCFLRNVHVRRQYLRQHAPLSGKLPSLLPEYVVPYTIYLLAHDPDYVTAQDAKQLKGIRECLRFVVDMLMVKNESNSLTFIRKLVENIKWAKCGQTLDNPKTNEKLHTVCNIALSIISKSNTYSQELAKGPALPARNFHHPDMSISSMKSHPPPGMKSFINLGKPRVASIFGAVNKTLPATARQPHAKLPWTEAVCSDSSLGWQKTWVKHSEYNEVSPVKISLVPGTQCNWRARDDSVLLRGGERLQGLKRRAATGEGDKHVGRALRPKRVCRRAVSCQFQAELQAISAALEPGEEHNSSTKRGRRGHTPRAASLRCGALTERGHKKPSPLTEVEEDDDDEELPAVQTRCRALFKTAGGEENNFGYGRRMDDDNEEVGCSIAKIQETPGRRERR